MPYARTPRYKARLRATIASESPPEHDLQRQRAGIAKPHQPSYDLCSGHQHNFHGRGIKTLLPQTDAVGASLRAGPLQTHC